MSNTDRVTVSRGSGNVFADIGLPNPEREQVKAALTLEIYRTIKQRKLIEVEVGDLLGIPQSHALALIRNRSGTNSIDILMVFLVALGHDIEIVVKPTQGKGPGVVVVRSP